MEHKGASMRKNKDLLSSSWKAAETAPLQLGWQDLFHDSTRYSTKGTIGECSLQHSGGQGRIYTVLTMSSQWRPQCWCERNEMPFLCIFIFSVIACNLPGYNLGILHFISQFKSFMYVWIFLTMRLENLTLFILYHWHLYS